MKTGYTYTQWPTAEDEKALDVLLYDCDNDGKVEILVGVGDIADGDVRIYEYRDSFWGGWDYYKDTEIDASPEEPVLGVSAGIVGSIPENIVFTGTSYLSFGSSELRGYYFREALSCPECFFSG